MLAILQNYEWLSVMPYHTGPLGGYRLLVSEYDIEDAVRALRHPEPAQEGERLEVSIRVGDRLLSLVLGVLAGGAPIPFRRFRWICKSS